MVDYDSIIIGTGQASGTIVPELLAMGQKVAVLEFGKVG